MGYLKPNTLSEIFQAKQGDMIIAPLIEGNTPYVLVIKVDSIIPVSKDEKKYKKIKMAVQNQISQEVNKDIKHSMINGLRELYKPKINLRMVDQIIANLQ